jgi:hypothetical protein
MHVLSYEAFHLNKKVEKEEKGKGKDNTKRNEDTENINTEYEKQ